MRKALFFIPFLLVISAHAKKIYKIEYTRAFYYKIDLNGQPETQRSIAPRGTQFKISGEIIPDNEIRIKILESEWSKIKSKLETNISAQFVLRVLNELPKSEMEFVSARSAQSPIVEVGEEYLVKKSDLEQAGYSLFRTFDLGILSIPFKMQIDGGQLSAGSALGPYLGYKIGPISGIMNVGVSGIPTQGLNDTLKSTLWGLTAAAGFIFEPVNQAQVGIIIGIDHTGYKDAFKYENKPWVSLAIGFAFLKRDI